MHVYVPNLVSRSVLWWDPCRFMDPFVGKITTASDHVVGSIQIYQSLAILVPFFYSMWPLGLFSIVLQVPTVAFRSPIRMVRCVPGHQFGVNYSLATNWSLSPSLPSFVSE